MIIGVDAGALCISDERLKVGVYRVIIHLLQELSHIDTSNQYRLFSFAPIEDAMLFSLSERMDNFVLRPSKAWFSLRLPLSMVFHPVDVFLGVSQAVPWGFQKNIGFIYDVGFIHHPEAYPQSSQKLSKQTASVIHRSEQIITISEASKKDICDVYKIAPERITVAYPGVDERFTLEGPRYKSRPYFLHVGSLKPGKNIPVLVKAFAEFKQKSQNDFVLLIIGGDYWMDSEIMRAIDTYGVQESVRLLGYVPDEVLPEYYRGATAFVSTSLSEGFCLPVVEAMASGCPVIASNAGAFPEVAPEESLLFAPDDSSAFAKGMETIATQTELRDIVIAKGIAKAEEYTWKQFADTVYSVINDTMKSYERT